MPVVKSALFIPVAVLLMLSQAATMYGRSHENPLRVQVVRTHWHSRRGWYSGFGRANLISNQPGQPPEQGMNFNFSCSAPVRFSFGPDTYTARYGKNPLEIIVQLPQPGSNKTKDCTLKVNMEDYVYVRTGHGLAAQPLAGGPSLPLKGDDEGHP